MNRSKLAVWIISGAVVATALGIAGVLSDDRWRGQGTWWITAFSFSALGAILGAGLFVTRDVRRNHVFGRVTCWIAVATAGFFAGYASEVYLNGASGAEWWGVILMGLIIGGGGALWETYMRWIAD